MQTIQLSLAGGPAIARLTIGQAQFGKFGVYVFQPNQTAFATAGTGHTPPGRQTFTLGDTAELKDCYLAWDVYVAPYTSAAGQLFSVLMEVLQNDQVVASIPDSGQFNGATPKLIRQNAVIQVA